MSEGIGGRVYEIPWFKRYKPELIEEYALAFRKVQRNLPVTVHINYEFDAGHTYPRPNYWYWRRARAF